MTMVLATSRFPVALLVIVALLIRSSQSQFNLLLNENETQRLFSFPCEMYYVRDDQIKQNAFRFIQLPFSINEVYFTWFAGDPHDNIHYHINVTSSHREAFRNPITNVALEGLVPHNRSELRVDFLCSGKVTGEFVLQIEIAVSSIASPLMLSRRKTCFRKGTSRYLEAYELSKLNYEVIELSEAEARRNATLVAGGGDAEQMEMRRVVEQLSVHGRRLLSYLLQDDRKRLIAFANVAFALCIVALLGVLFMIVRRRFVHDRQFLMEISLIGAAKNKRVRRKKRRTKTTLKTTPKFGITTNRRDAAKNCVLNGGMMQAQQLNALLDDISSSSTTEDDGPGGYCDSDSSDSLGSVPRSSHFYRHFAYVQRTVAEPWSCMNELQVANSRVQLLEVLQSGTFARVYHALLRDEADDQSAGRHMLLKTVTTAAHRDQVTTMLQNGTLLLGVTHQHINAPCAASIIDASLVSDDGFHGFMVQSQQTTVPCLLYPYADVGNLKLFLAELRLPESRKQRYTLTTAHIVNLATQLCKAVNYLHRTHIIHKDIATRNCLINSSLVVKLTDSVLSRDLFPDDYCCIGDNENRPVKWLALEALIERKFSTATDVWSFGVTLWELITRAQEPYMDIDSFEMIVYLRDGRRLEKPKNCPDDLYDIMMSCWLTNPDNRPTPAFILNKLKHFAVKIGGYL